MGSKNNVVAFANRGVFENLPLLLQDQRGGADPREDNLRTQRDQLFCIFAQARGIAHAPAIIDAQIAPGGPA
jgi:hypothetical protein